MATPTSAPVGSAEGKAKFVKIAVAGVALAAAVALIVWNMIPEPMATGGTAAPTQDTAQSGQAAQQKVAEPAGSTGGGAPAQQAATGDGGSNEPPPRGNYRLAPERKK